TVEPEIHEANSAPRRQRSQALAADPSSGRLRRIPPARGEGISSRQCRQASRQDNDGVGARQSSRGSESSWSSSRPRSRMYLRPERIGWSAPRVAWPTPSQSPWPAWREKRRTSPATKTPLGRLRLAAARETRRAKSPPIERTAARAIWGFEQVRTISRTIMGRLLSVGLGRAGKL